MKNWTWQQWVGKLLLLAITIVEAVAGGLGFEVPLWTIIGTGLTWVAQFVLGLLPGEAWQKILGKILLLAVSTVGLALGELGLNVPIWAVLAPMITALAQYFISLVPSEPAPA